MDDAAPRDLRSEAQDPAMAAGCAYAMGRYLPVAEAAVPILDWGFLRSDATYDVVHVWEGRFFRLADHLARFLASMEKLRLKPKEGPEEIVAILSHCVRRAGLESAYVEMLCTRGQPPAGSRDPRLCENRFFAFAIPFVWIATPTKQESGLHLKVSRYQRIQPASVDPTIKNYHWMDLTRGLMEVLDAGGETAVLNDGAGNVVEGPGFNIFALIDGRLVTPAHGMLEGITRKTIVELAERHGLPIDISHLPIADLRRAQEIFLTSTAGGVMPVTRLDDAPVGQGKPGPITGELRAAYWDLHRDPAYSSRV